MTRKVFVSYVFEDRTFRSQVVDWAQKQLLGDIDPVFEAEDVRSGGETAIRAHLRPIMSSADGILVLVGQDTHNRQWVDAEVHAFMSARKPIVLARIPGTTGAAPPEVQRLPLLPFSPAQVRDAFKAAFSAK